MQMIICWGPRAEGRSRADQGGAGAVPAETLALELNPDKTLITHARTQPARFLGYDIIVQHCNTRITHGLRSANGKVALRVPPDVVKAQCAATGSGANPGTGPGSRTCPTMTSCGSTGPNTGAS